MRLYSVSSGAEVLTLARSTQPTHGVLVSRVALLRSRSLRSVVTLSVVVLTATAFTGGASLAATGAVTPVTPAGLTAAIEVAQPYIGQSTCDPVAQAGVTAFRDLMLQTYPDTGSLGIVQDCGVPGQSEHKEGRAFDWAVSVDNPQQVAEVKALLTWLLATDSYGNTYAMAKRLGVMYIIWDHQMWRAYSNSEHQANHWDPYVGVSGHTDHVHFSFGWNGARKATSFWTGVVAPVYTSGSDAGPAPVATPSGANRALRSRFGQFSLQRGSTGEAVKALQEGLRITADGDYGPLTAKAVSEFQGQHGRPVTGTWGRGDWAAMFPLPEDAPPAPPTPTTASPTPVATPAPVASGANRALRSRFGQFSLQRGSTGEAVKALQEGLRITADGDYGPLTAKAVSEFQGQHGRPVTGTWGRGDWAAMFPLPEDAPPAPPTPTTASPTPVATPAPVATGANRALRSRFGQFSLQRGSTGEAVKALQNGLRITADGDYGPLTAKAVSEFQGEHGRPVTGTWGRGDWAAMFPLPEDALLAISGGTRQFLPYASAFLITGTAGANTPVSVHLRPAGRPAGDFSVVRTVVADASGAWQLPLTLVGDTSYFATAGEQTTAVVVTTAVPSVDGPSSRVVPRGRRYTLTGRATPGSQVELRLRRADRTPGEFNIVRRAAVDPTGRCSFSYVALADYSFYVLRAPGADRTGDATWLVRAR